MRDRAEAGAAPQAPRCSVTSNGATDLRGTRCRMTIFFCVTCRVACLNWKVALRHKLAAHEVTT